MENDFEVLRCDNVSYNKIQWKDLCVAASDKIICMFKVILSSKEIFAKKESQMINPAVISKVLQFRDDRNWKQFHNPKDLAISISLEAAELLENFQWSGADLDVPEKSEKIEDELADVLIYCTLMADAMGMNMNEIVSKKLEKNAKKYNVDKAFGSSKKYTELE